MRRGAKFVSLLSFVRKPQVLTFGFTSQHLCNAIQNGVDCPDGAKCICKSLSTFFELGISRGKKTHSSFSRFLDGHHCPRGPTCSRQHCAFNDEVSFHRVFREMSLRTDRELVFDSNSNTESFLLLVLLFVVVLRSFPLRKSPFSNNNIKDRSRLHPRLSHLVVSKEIKRKKSLTRLPD